MPKPSGYPLPWCDMLDAPYWRVNMMLIFYRPDWRQWQAKLSMSEIIPEIDRILAEPEQTPMR